mgnify:CR=1 FL=1
MRLSRLRCACTCEGERADADRSLAKAARGLLIERVEALFAAEERRYDAALGEVALPKQAAARIETALTHVEEAR